MTCKTELYIVSKFAKHMNDVNKLNIARFLNAPVKKNFLSQYKET